MAYGSCIFLRVQCEARELVPEQSGCSSAYASTSAGYDSPTTHQNIYEPLQNSFQPYMTASNTSEISPGPQLYRSRSSIGGTQRERIHQEHAILMNAPHLLSRSLPDKTLGSSRLGYSSTRQRMHEDSYPPTLHRRPLMHVPTSLELGDSPLSNSMDLSVTGAHYPIRSLSQDASMMPSSYYETPWGSQLFNGGRSNSAHTLLYGQESTGVLSYPLLDYCSAASAKSGTLAPLEVDNSGPFPALGSLSSSLPTSSLSITSIPTSTISERPNSNQFSTTISDKIALPAICAPAARPVSPEFIDKSVATLGSNFPVTRDLSIGISVGNSAEPSSIYGPQSTKEMIQPYLIEPSLSTESSSTKHNYVVSAPESHVRSTKPSKDHPVQMIRLSSSYPSISSKQGRVSVADKKSTTVPIVSSFPAEGNKEATKNEIGYSPPQDSVSFAPEKNTFNSQSYTDSEIETGYKSLANDQAHPVPHSKE